MRESDKGIILASDQPKSVDVEVLMTQFKNKTIRVAYTLPEYINAALRQYEQPLETRFSTIIASDEHVAPEIVDEIIRDALTFEASDIHFEPRANDVVVRFRTDGELREAGRLPKENYANILNRIKVESGMRIDEHYSTQDGAIQRRDEDINVDLRVSLTPTINGEKIVCRVLGSYVKNYTLADIGLSQENRAILEDYASRPFGMILTVGPTGSGKTTTLYSLVKLLNQPNVNITTIEDPVEYKIENINQIQVREASQLTFSKGLRSIVRQDPDVILVGEIRDQETAEISVNAALTGHLLLSTFHANDAATAIPRLIDMDVEPFLLASTLELVIAQRLVRNICSHCKHTINYDEATKTISPSLVKKLENYISSNTTLYSGKGCSVCNHTGYAGRSALFELLEMTPAMQELVLDSPSTQAIAALAKKEGAKTMFEDGVTKATNGTTTISEVLRVVKPGN